MPQLPFRFLHASDLHLARPLGGVAEIPDHLRASLVDAPAAAAVAAFDAALAEEVDFVLLAGDVIDVASSGPADIVLLIEQFERLAAREIAVYWAGGQVDSPALWPRTMTLPPNVHVFPTGRPHTWTATRDGRPLARVAGTSREHATAVQLGPLAATGSDDCFHIGVAHRVAPSKTVEPLACHYWALGGRHRRTTVCTSPATCHDPGSTQGRGFDEPGAHGCTLVAVDEDRKIRTSMIATDVVRYVDESVTVDDCEDRDALEPILRQRIGRIAQSTGDRMSLVRLHLECSNPQGDASQRRTLAAELTDWLRVEFGHGEPAAWAVGLDFRSASVPEALSKQETILGDFLRAVEHYESNEEDPIELDRFLSERHVAGCLAAAMRPDDPNVRRRVLREAAQLGIDLLGVPGK